MRPYQTLIDSIYEATKYKYLTMDQDGSWFIHREKPVKDGKSWLSGDFYFMRFLPEDTTINWQEAIFEAKTQNIPTGTKAEKYVM